jgi:hypothetical protein
MFFLPGALVVVVAILAALGYLGARAFQDWRAKGPALAAARVRFAPVRDTMLQRLAQGRPMELGQVWITHTGRICGLVNGEGAFAGHPGMTPFYSDGNTPYFSDGLTPFHTDGAEVHFALDSQTDQFEGQWIACNQDGWAVLSPGSAGEGPCATKGAPARCKRPG